MTLDRDALDKITILDVEVLRDDFIFSGHIYIIEFENRWTKVGRTTRAPSQRFREHEAQQAKRHGPGFRINRWWASAAVFEDSPAPGRDVSPLALAERHLRRKAEALSTRYQTGNKPSFGNEFFYGCDFEQLRTCARTLEERAQTQLPPEGF